MKNILIPNIKKYINFSNPLNGRKWLNLLEAHSQYGLLFKKNLKYDFNQLGFSFSSNHLGLRGPDNVAAPNVILGTSFGMGLSVNNGENWYELILDKNKWLNVCMPVGPQNNIELINGIYKGNYETLLYIYHPNIWKLSKSFDAAKKNKIDIFSHLNWKTNILSVFPMYLRWIIKEIAKINLGHSLYLKNNFKEYNLNTRYTYLKFDENLEFVNRQIFLLNSIFEKFRKVIVLRVPVKEELFPIKNKKITGLKKNYDSYWHLFRTKLNNDICITDLSKGFFKIDDYLQYDTHWNKYGNQTFAKIVKSILLDNKIDL